MFFNCNVVDYYDLEDRFKVKLFRKKVAGSKNMHWSIDDKFNEVEKNENLFYSRVKESQECFRSFVLKSDY